MNLVFMSEKCWLLCSQNSWFSRNTRFFDNLRACSCRSSKKKKNKLVQGSQPKKGFTKKLKSSITSSFSFSGTANIWGLRFDTGCGVPIHERDLSSSDRDLENLSPVIFMK